MNSNIRDLKPFIDAYAAMRRKAFARAKENGAQLAGLDARIRDLGDDHPRNAEYRSALDRIAEGMLRCVTSEAADLRKVEHGILEAFAGPDH